MSLKIENEKSIMMIKDGDLIVNNRSFNDVCNELEALKNILIKSKLVTQKEIDKIRETIEITEKLDLM